MNVLSLFSGAGGMDLGFEGGFSVLKPCVNAGMHPDWVEYNDGMFVTLKHTMFHTVFANDIRRDAEVAWTRYFGRKYGLSGVYQLGSIVDIVRSGGAVRAKKFKAKFS